MSESNVSRAIAVEVGDSTAMDEALFRKVAWRFIPFLFLCYLIAQVDRMDVGFAKLTMLADLRFSEVIYGIGAGVFFIGYVACEVPSNILLRRFGAPSWLGRIMVSWGVVSVAMMFIRTPLQFYLLRFLLGVAEAGFFPGVIYYLGDWFPAARRTRMTALFMSAIAMSGVMVGPVSGLILARLNGFAGMAGWRWLFLFEGAPAILLGLITPRLLNRSPRDAAWLNPAERARIATLVTTEHASASDASLLRALSHPRVLALGLVYACYGVSFFGLVFWLPTIVQASGVADPLAIGLLSALPWMAGVAAMLVAGAYVDRRGRTRAVLVGLALISALGWGLSPWARGHVGTAILLCALATAGAMGSLPVFWNLPAAMFQGAAAAAAIALISAIGNLPGFFSPYVVAVLKQTTGSLDIPMYLFAGAMAVAAAMLGWLVPSAAGQPEGAPPDPPR
ncbi:MAG: MFS transporter [Caulobacteraceae bacterium]